MSKKKVIIKSNNIQEESFNEYKSEFKDKRIVIIKKKERKKNNKDHFAHKFGDYFRYKNNRDEKKSNELEKQKKNNIT